MHFASRDYFELRVYHITNKDQEAVIDDFLKNALLPALHRNNRKTIGVFKPLANDTAADKKIYVLIPHKSIKDFIELPAKLERVVPLLERNGYKFVEIFLADKENKREPDVWWLHVEKVEIHTPNTLNERNKVFYKFADENDLASYDGMDVGPVEATH